jgi:hypothetical protein
MFPDPEPSYAIFHGYQWPIIDPGFMHFTVTWDLSDNTIRAPENDYAGAFEVNGIYDRYSLAFTKRYVQWSWEYEGL